MVSWVRAQFRSRNPHLPAPFHLCSPQLHKRPIALQQPSQHHHRQHIHHTQSKPPPRVETYSTYSRWALQSRKQQREVPILEVRLDSKCAARRLGLSRLVIIAGMLPASGQWSIPAATFLQPLPGSCPVRVKAMHSTLVVRSGSGQRPIMSLAESALDSAGSHARRSMLPTNYSGRSEQGSHPRHYTRSPTRAWLLRPAGSDRCDQSSPIPVSPTECSSPTPLRETATICR